MDKQCYLAIAIQQDTSLMIHPLTWGLLLSFLLGLLTITIAPMLPELPGLPPAISAGIVTAGIIGRSVWWAIWGGG